MGKAALIVVLGASLVMGNMLVGLNQRSVIHSESINAHYESIISRNIANSAANMAASELFRDFNWRTGLGTTSLNGGSLSATAQDVVFDTTLTVKRVQVTAVSNFAGSSDTVVVVLHQPPFSQYASFNDKWSPTLVYSTGDTFWGPVHTNGIFRMTGSPVFFGKVTSVGATYGTIGTTNPQFLGGVEFGVDPVPLPTSLPALIDSANSGGDVYTDHAWLRFNADGSYDYGSDNTYSGGTKYISDYNGTLMTQGPKDIHVKGTLHGQLTIYSGRHIYIEDDIVYANDPQLYPGSQDMLGLVSTKNVIVADTPANQTDVVIDAAIMALDKSFKVDHYDQGGPKGTLTTFGSIVQKENAPHSTGQFVGGVWTITNGYADQSIYDQRFLQVGPPVFPLVPRVSVFSWLE
ncbi:MAG: hypothetical protein ACE5HO_10120 [bacterium]